MNLKVVNYRTIAINRIKESAKNETAAKPECKPLTH